MEQIKSSETKQVKPKRPEHRQIAFIHMLRGVALLLVLWAHLGGWWLSISGNQSVLQTTWIDIVVRPLHLYQDGGHLGVLLFFLVSGYIITHVSLREKPSEFVVKRVFRLFPTLCVAIALMPLLRLLSDSLQFPEVMGNQSDDYLTGLFLINYITGSPQVLTLLWTLFIEVIFYGLTAAFITLSYRSPILATWIILGITLGLHMAAQWVPSMNQLMWEVMYVPFLVLGRSIYLTIHRVVSLGEGLIACVASYGFFLLIYSNTGPGRLIITGAEPIISHFIAIVAFLALALSGVRTTWKPLAFVAETSYPVYLIHAPLGGFCLFLLTSRGLPYELALPIAIAVVFLVAFGIFQFVEKPVQRVARRFRFQKKPTPTPATS